MIAAMAVAPAGPAHVAEAPAGSTEVLAQLRQLAGRPDLRPRVTGDQMVALIDVAMLFMGVNNNEAANAARRVLDAFPAVTTKCFICQFEGARQRPIHVAPIAVAIEFAFLLPGRRAAQLRMQAARLLVRYLGGDLSLIDEIAQLRHVQQALASVPTESLTPEQQTVRACGAAVEAATPQPVLAGPPQTEYLPAAPSCLDNQPADLYVLSCERGFRPGRTSLATKEGRLASHRREYGQSAFFALYAPNFGHVETALHRHLKPISANPENPRNEIVPASSITVEQLKDAIRRLDAMARDEAALKSAAELSHKRSREEAREEQELQAKRRREDADAELERKLREADAEAKRKREEADAEAKRKREEADAEVARQLNKLSSLLNLVKTDHDAAMSGLVQATINALAPTAPAAPAAPAARAPAAAQAPAPAPAPGPADDARPVDPWSSPGAQQFLAAIFAAKKGARYPKEGAITFEGEAACFMQAMPNAFILAIDRLKKEAGKGRKRKAESVVEKAEADE